MMPILMRKIQSMLKLSTLINTGFQGHNRCSYEYSQNL